MPSDTSTLLLARAPALTARQLTAAVELAGDLERVARLSAGALADCKWPAAAVAWAREPDRAELDRDSTWLEASGARLISCTSADYPPLLREVDDAPAFLYVLGNTALLASLQLAIVGSRNPTPAGRSDSFEFARFLAGGGLTVTSGLAVGIDAAAHRGALKAGGQTIAVCGTGLDSVYPREHVGLAAEIAAQGALVSEFPPRSPPLPQHFPRRNRIISGLCLGVLVVEAARRSGSLSTARHAGEQGREVFAIPGSIHNPLTRGCHQLIRSGAKLVERAADILEELQVPFTRQSLASAETGNAAPNSAAPRLDKDYEILLDALGFEPTGVDVIIERTGLAADSVASMLLILELEGRIAPFAGGRYCRVPEES